MLKSGNSLDPKQQGLPRERERAKPVYSAGDLRPFPLPWRVRGGYGNGTFGKAGEWQQIRSARIPIYIPSLRSWSLVSPLRKENRAKRWRCHQPHENEAYSELGLSGTNLESQLLRRMRQEDAEFKVRVSKVLSSRLVPSNFAVLKLWEWCLAPWKSTCLARTGKANKTWPLVTPPPSYFWGKLRPRVK